jgi:hypothetical protein
LENLGKVTICIHTYVTKRYRGEKSGETGREREREIYMHILVFINIKITAR